MPSKNHRPVPLSSRARIIARRIFNAVGDQRNLVQGATSTESAAFHPVASLAAYPAEGIVAYPVSRRVNDPKNDDAKLVEPEPT